MRRDFIEQFASGEIKLPYHRAEKKVAYIDDEGELISPDQPNAVKFETFVFDALPFAKNPLILEADRLEEFSPVKNMTGVDSLESSQADQVKRARRWLANAEYLVSESSRIEFCPLAFPDEQDLLGTSLKNWDPKADEIYLGEENRSVRK